jgi:hypothetical protein
MKRKEYLPPTDPNNPAHRAAKVAIDMVHDFADRNIVYDGSPIDDPIRETALCVVSAVQLKGGRTVEKALQKLPYHQKRDLVDTIRSVIEIGVDKINHAGDNLHQINPYEQPAVDNPNALPKMSTMEQLQVIAKEAHIIANHWDMIPDHLGQRERIMGAVHDVLALLQNGNPSVPAMLLTPVDPETNEGCVALVRRGTEFTAADWNYGQPMHPQHPAPSGNAQLFYTNNAPGSLTAQFQHIYETTRERYRTAARDLFGDPSDD